MNRRDAQRATTHWSRYSKPTYQSIDKSLIDLFDKAQKAGIKKIAMPKIGCGLDRKDWNQVKKLILKH